MPLLLTGKKFHNDLKTNKCIAIFAPLEGGYETRLLRRMRAKGFKTFITSARGLGDPEVFLLQLHGVRPPHLGHQSVGRNGALGEVQQVIPQASELFNENDKNKLLWLLVLKIDDQKNLLVVKGSVPGKPGTIVNIKPNNVVGKKGGEKS